MRIIRTKNAKEDLCDTCIRRKDYPACTPRLEKNIGFGNGVGNDNIIACCNYMRPLFGVKHSSAYGAEIINADEERI